MDGNQLDALEHDLHRAPLDRAPPELRVATLKKVHRQLAGQRWERRLCRLTLVILALGLGLNWFVGRHDRGWPASRSEIVSRPQPIAIIEEVAVAIGQATDAQTGNRIAQHLATLSGAVLSPEQAAAIDQQIRQRAKSTNPGRKEDPS